MSHYLEQVNEVQREAVQCTEGPVMIIAGAGSGKTRVLTYRVAHLVEKGVDPFHILSLTFTNKAAREMKDRISKLVGNEAMNLWMGTFHSVFARILRIESTKINYPSNFTIYDTDDSKSLISDIIKENQLDDKVYKPSAVLNRISSAKNNLFNWMAYQDNAQLVSEDTQSGKPKIGSLFEQYSKRCFNAGAMDFDDILYNTYILLRDHEQVLEKYQQKFQYIMVDEFQDTNYAQYIIVKKLSASHHNICVVGDDAQSIYAFRGANIQNILSFEKDYPELQTFKLEQNYRSTKTIVKAANSVIVNNKHQLKKEVWTDNHHGEKIRVLRALSDNEEGTQVAQMIFEDKMNLHYDNKDFAILYRTNAQSRSMEEALRRANIPYRVFGGVSFYKRKEVKDLLAYFRLAINLNDEEALKRVINYPARGIGKTTLEKIIVAASQENTSVWNVMRNIHEFKTGIAGGIRERIAEFATMISSFNIMLPTHNAAELAGHIAKSSGLLHELYNDRTPEGIVHYENIQALINGIQEFSDRGIQLLESPSSEDVKGGIRTLDDYMQDIALLTDSDTDKEDDKNKVSLMTIHTAKGLEFKEVFVVGLEENLFPSQLAMNSRTELEEERRLFYVAITRAETKLTLSHADMRYRWGKLVESKPSRFVEEVDPECLEIPVKKSAKHYEEDHTGWNNFGQSNRSYNNQQKSNSDYRNVNKTVTPATNGKSAAPKGFTKLTQANLNASDFVGDDLTGITVGTDVEHQRFGNGKVISLEGKQPDIKAVILFDEHGQKQLLLKFAKLKIVNP